MSSDLVPQNKPSDLAETQPSQQNPAAVYVASLVSDHSRRNMWRHLNRIAALVSGGRHDAWSLDWSAMRYEHTQAVRAHLAGEYAPSTVNAMLSALRGTLKAAWRLGQMHAEDYARAADVSSVKGETVPSGRNLTQGEIAALARACKRDTGPAGVRDAAMIGVLYTCGIRRSELARLQREDFDAADEALKVRSGKGRKERIVYPTNGALRALREWLEIRGDEPGPLFVPINKGGAIQWRGMTSQAVYDMLKRRADQAEVSDFSPHDFRRTFVGDLLDQGADIVTVQKLAGHASPTTTSRYDRRPEEAKRKAAQKLHFPY